VMAVVTTAMAGPLLTWILGRRIGDGVTDQATDLSLTPKTDHRSRRATGTTAS